MLYVFLCGFVWFDLHINQANNKIVCRALQQCYYCVYPLR